MNSGDPAPTLPACRDRPSGGGRLAGRVYLERGRPVMMLAGWGPGGGPRNVLVRRAGGALVVRPFRGLRRPRPTPPGGPPAAAPPVERAERAAPADAGRLRRRPEDPVKVPA